MVCGTSLAWMQTTPIGSMSIDEVLSVRHVIGWIGLVIAAGFSVAGLLCWPYCPDRAQCKQGSPITAYDDVTGLPTRRLYLVLVRQALGRAEATARNVAVLVCTLEQFRPLSVSSAAPNMTLVVRVQAARIKSALRPHDVVARLDEYTFAVIADNLESPDEARLIAEKIQHAIALPLLIEGQELLLSCRIGGIVGPRKGVMPNHCLMPCQEPSRIVKRSRRPLHLCRITPRPSRLDPAKLIQPKSSTTRARGSIVSRP